MKKVTRYELRYNNSVFCTDNLFGAYEMYTTMHLNGKAATIHEITTTERDITDNARVENVELPNNHKPLKP